MYKTFNGVKLYDLDSLNEILGLSKVSIRAYIKRGLIKARKIGIKWFVTEKNLSDFINQNHSNANEYLHETTADSDSSAQSINKDLIFTSSHLYPQLAVEAKSNGHIDITKVLPIESVTETWEYWLDSNLNVTYVSPLCEKITGYKVAEFLSNSSLVRSIIYSEDLPQYTSYIQNPDPQRNPGSKIRIYSKTGDLRLLNVSSKVILGQNGKTLGIQVFNTDITNEMNLNVINPLMNGFISNLANELDLIVIVLDKDFKVIAFNNRAFILSLVGFKEVLKIGDYLPDIVHDKYREEDFDALTKAQSGIVQRLERQAGLTEQDLKNFLVHMFPTHFNDTNSNDVCIIIEDVDSQISRLNNHINQNYEYFDKYEQVKSIVLATDKSRQILYINKLCTEKTGWSKEEVIGTSVIDYIDEETLSKLPAESEKLWSTGVNYGIPLNLKCKDGSELRVRLISFIEKQPKGPVVISFLKVLDQSEE